MDIDISDILADVSRSSHGELGSDQPDPSTSHLDHQSLTRAWTNERNTAHLLPYPAELMHRVLTRVRAQIEKIEDLASGGGVSGHSGGTSNANLNLTLSILQTDLSRTQFLIRSLLRQRLAKLTKYAAFYLHGMSADTKSSLLSTTEVGFLQDHQALLGDFYGASFLDAFPVALRRLDDSSGGVSMLEGPDEKACVFTRCLAERWENDPGMDEEDEGVELRMQKGEVWVVRWEDVRKGVLDGALELL